MHTNVLVLAVATTFAFTAGCMTDDVDAAAPIETETLEVGIDAVAGEPRDLDEVRAEASASIAAVYPCQDSGWDWRCLTYLYLYGSVFVTNTSTTDVTFLHEERHSHCGWPSWGLGVSRYVVGPGRTVAIPFRWDPDQLLCRENFVFDCTVYGAELDCDRVVSVDWRN